MGGRTLHYVELTASALAELDRERAIAFMALSPIEVHGPHLPLGTDVMVAEELQRRVMARLRERLPEHDFLVLPTTYVGADTVPAPASVDVDSRAVHHIVLATGEALARQGFRYLVLTDNHGGPRHQIAIEKAVRKLYRRHGFCVVAPFLGFFREMVEQDQALLETTGTGPGSCGAADDSHAGTNETSLMLVVAPERMDPRWAELPRVRINANTPIGRLLRGLGRVAGFLGARRLARDLGYLGITLSWVGMKKEEMPTYVGGPAEASREAGERMLEAHAEAAVRLLERAMQGEPPFSVPLLWDLRFIERS
ncbi:MAG TPA: creatininase family protein [Anaerolineae bacterium]|nr:creatininase family protein [Anaerolineae bacterium]